MTEAESPGAMAALGASEDDQLCGRVDQENSSRSLNPQPLSLRGNGVSYDACGTPLASKPGSRRQRYCGSACRQAGYRARKRAGRCTTASVTSNRLANPPLELLGRRHRWPGAARREIAGTIHSIITSELDALDIITRTGDDQ